MMRSLYSAVSGMRGFQTKMDVIGNNIANVNTVGFKASRVMFHDLISQTLSGATAPGDTTGGSNPQQVGLGVGIASIDTPMTPGAPMMTGVPTDLAIDGNGFFVVQLSDGATQAYTRAGNFHIDSNRNLVTSEGLFVLDTGGAPIQLPDNTKSVSIDKNGNVNCLLDDGTTQTAAQIGLANFANPEGLQKIGNNLFVETTNSGPADVQAPNQGVFGSITSGALEMSNVDLTNEFTEMIIAQRAFQANARTITSDDQMLQEVVNLKR
ncbi:MAG: flagellar basal-body rod protein FlgG [Kyrpidia tusciae]|nr:flagellar basal body rod protein FlgG [Kyrpidia tusciae]MBE3553040.1 flagellar basal-body rod protein FlgG [Kyrpidia tusciae]